MHNDTTNPIIVPSFCDPSVTPQVQRAPPWTTLVREPNNYNPPCPLQPAYLPLCKQFHQNQVQPQQHNILFFNLLKMISPTRADNAVLTGGLNLKTVVGGYRTSSLASQNVSSLQGASKNYRLANHLNQINARTIHFAIRSFHYSIISATICPSTSPRQSTTLLPASTNPVASQLARARGIFAGIHGETSGISFL